MNLNKLMKQAQQMQAQMAKAQAELEEKTVEVTAAGGKIKVTANGAGEILLIKIDQAIVDPSDVEFLEEAVLSGVQQAIEQGKALAQCEHNDVNAGNRGAKFGHAPYGTAQPGDNERKPHGDEPTFRQKK